MFGKGCAASEGDGIKSLANSRTAMDGQTGPLDGKGARGSRSYAPWCKDGENIRIA